MPASHLRNLAHPICPDIYAWRGVGDVRDRQAVRKERRPGDQVRGVLNNIGDAIGRGGAELEYVTGKHLRIEQPQGRGWCEINLIVPARDVPGVADASVLEDATDEQI